MLFNIAPSNAERVKREFTAIRPEHSHGYFKSVILTSPSRSYIYRVDMICGYYVMTVRNSREQVEIIANFEQYKPESITVIKGELYRSGSGYPYRTERNEKYLKKYDQLACIVHGAIAAGLLFDMMKDEPTPAPLPAQESPTAEETSTAGETSNETEKGPEKATQKRRAAYIVECRSPRDDWKRYSDEQPTQEAAEQIKEEAETRHALTQDGEPIFYRLVTIDKGPEAAQEAPTTDGTTEPGETSGNGETLPQEATTEAKTADHDSGATSETTPGLAAGNTSGTDQTGETSGPAADTITGQTTHNTSGTAAGATSGLGNPATIPEPATAAGVIPGATSGTDRTPPQNPGHACENAPGRTERATAEHVPTGRGKSPPRAAQRAGDNRPRTRGSPRKVGFWPQCDCQVYFIREF